MLMKRVIIFSIFFCNVNFWWCCKSSAINYVWSFDDWFRHHQRPSTKNRVLWNVKIVFLWHHVKGWVGSQHKLLIYWMKVHANNHWNILEYFANIHCCHTSVHVTFCVSVLQWRLKMDWRQIQRLSSAKSSKLQWSSKLIVATMLCMLWSICRCRHFKCHESKSSTPLWLKLGQNKYWL